MFGGESDKVMNENKKKQRLEEGSGIPTYVSAAV